jgi:hypothetical protein
MKYAVPLMLIGMAIIAFGFMVYDLNYWIDLSVQ